MYVKVTGGRHHFGGRGDFLTRVEPPLYTDYTAIELADDARWGDDGELESLGSTDFHEALGAAIEFIHMLEFQPERTVYEENTGIVAFRYAWWHDSKTGLTAVVTTRSIFVLGENGKTIDRV